MARLHTDSFSVKDPGCRAPETASSEGEGEGEGEFIAREGIEHSQSRPPRRCIPCHADVVGDLVGRVAAPATKAKFYWIDFPYFT